MSKLIFILLIFFPGVSFAFCPSFRDLKHPITTCEDNFELSNAALDCLDLFTSHVKAGQARVRLQLQAELANLKTDQNGNFVGAEASYRKAQIEMQRLANDGILAKQALETYMAEMFFPDDWDQPKVTGMESAAYLASTACFASPRRALMSSQKLVSNMVTDLIKTNFAAGQKQGVASSHSQKSQNLQGQPQPKRVLIEESQEGKDGNNSGISGTTDPRDKKK